MPIAILFLKNETSEVCVISNNDEVLPAICVDRDHAIDVGRHFIADFDDLEFEMEYFVAASADGFPSGYRPYTCVKGRKPQYVAV